MRVCFGQLIDFPGKLVPKSLLRRPTWTFGLQTVLLIVKEPLKASTKRHRLINRLESVVVACQSGCLGPQWYDQARNGASHPNDKQAKMCTLHFAPQWSCVHYTFPHSKCVYTTLSPIVK